MRILGLVSLMIVLAAAAVVALASTARPNPAKQAKEAAVAMLTHLPRGPYRPGGLYVGPRNTNIDPPNIILDRTGLPLVRYTSGYHRNPVTVAQYGLWAYGAGDRRAFLNAADWLVANQMRGRWLYRFDFSEFGWKMKAPWSSAMAQGQAMSLLERAYRATGNRRYLQAALAAVGPLETNVRHGGLTRCFRGDCRLPFFEEYPTRSPTYVLNGFMFTLVGLYDLASVAPRSNAKRLYREGRRTLDKIIPLYDRQEGAVYELGYQDVMAPPKYQAIHVYLMRALSSLRPDQELDSYASIWRGDLISSRP